MSLSGLTRQSRPPGPPLDSRLRGNDTITHSQCRCPAPFSPPSAIARIKAQVDETLMASGLPATVVHLPDFYGPGVVNKLIRPGLPEALCTFSLMMSVWMAVTCEGISASARRLDMRKG